MLSTGPKSLLKLWRSRVATLSLVFAMMLAALGSFFNKDISPK
jgi:hypothetical protein